MEHFSHFALMASIGMIIILLWRLNIAVSTQSEMATSITSQTDSIEQDRQAAEERAIELSVLNDQLTESNQAITEQNTQQRSNLDHLKSDHATLQIKCGELEKDLLAQMHQNKKFSENLQTEQLEKANLQRRLETLQERQITQNKGVKELQTELNTLQEKSKLYQKAVQAAKGKIDTLEKDKKQLERDLQQALYQVVELEQIQLLQTVAENPLQPQQASNDLPQNSSEPSLPSFS